MVGRLTKSGDHPRVGGFWEPQPDDKEPSIIMQPKQGPKKKKSVYRVGFGV